VPARARNKECVCYHIISSPQVNWVEENHRFGIFGACPSSTRTILHAKMHDAALYPR